MTRELRHRGPDDSGLWQDGASGVTLGFRRLAISDPSPSGHQPSVSADGRYVLVYNGELYNAAELRARIDRSPHRVIWRGTSDTEVLLEAIAAWGVERALQMANAMLAIAVWDRRTRSLTLARDRIGKKPLYYGFVGDSLAFASELKGLWMVPGFDFDIDRAAFDGFLRRGHIGGGNCIFRNARKLPPGHLLQIQCEDIVARALPEPRCWWSLGDVALDGIERRQSEPADIEELAGLIDDAVDRRAQADVPVGLFLSGGVDSALVGASMSRGGARTPAFSLGLDVPAWDERARSAALAAHFGMQHSELDVTAANAAGVLDDLAQTLDEPNADDSALLTLLLSRRARQDVKVVLTGDGGDELFGGYRRYAIVETWLARRAAIPERLRPLVHATLRRIVSPALTFGSDVAGHGAFARRRLALLDLLLRHDDFATLPETFNAALKAYMPDPATALGQAWQPEPADEAALSTPTGLLNKAPMLDRLTFGDAAGYLVDGILAKVDRTSMAASLEVRCPLLDYRIVSLAWRFDPAEKLSGGIGKRHLRTLLRRRVPDSLVQGPKLGFGAPVETWLRGPMLPWADGLMTEDALSAHGLLDVPSCRAAWLAYLGPRRLWSRTLWAVLVFQAWHRTMVQARRANEAMVHASISAAG